MHTNRKVTSVVVESDSRHDGELIMDRLNLNVGADIAFKRGGEVTLKHARNLICRCRVVGIRDKSAILGTVVEQPGRCSKKKVNKQDG
jgi:hypothetical protein